MNTIPKSPTGKILDPRMFEYVDIEVAGYSQYFNTDPSDNIPLTTRVIAVELIDYVPTLFRIGGRQPGFYGTRPVIEAAGMKVEGVIGREWGSAGTLLRKPRTAVVSGSIEKAEVAIADAYSAGDIPADVTTYLVSEDTGRSGLPKNVVADSPVADPGSNVFWSVGGSYPGVYSMLPVGNDIPVGSAEVEADSSRYTSTVYVEFTGDVTSKAGYAAVRTKVSPLHPSDFSGHSLIRIHLDAGATSFPVSHPIQNFYTGGDTKVLPLISPQPILTSLESATVGTSYTSNVSGIPQPFISYGLFDSDLASITKSAVAEYAARCDKFSCLIVDAYASSDSGGANAESVGHNHDEYASSAISVTHLPPESDGSAEVAEAIVEFFSL